MNDVMAGQVPLFFANVASSLGQIQSGRLRPLAVTSRRRTRSLPDMPTMEEAGVPAYEVLEWNPVLAPAGIDAKSKAALIAAIRKTMADPEVLGRIRSLSGEAFPEGPEGLTQAFLKAQQLKWGRIVKDLIRLAKAKPGQIAYASSGNGSAQHLAGALFEDLAGVKLVHVPYRGGGPAMNDVMAGQVPLFFANVASSLGQIQSGRLRPLAVTSRRRTRSLPDMPTMEEAGVPAYEVLEWNPVLAPAGIDAKSKAALIAAIRKTMADPEVLGRIRSLSGEAFPEGPEALTQAFLKAQQLKWGRIIKDRKITTG